MNGEFRTDHRAHFTTETFTGIRHLNNVVTFAISLGSLIKDMLWTELYAEAAPLAPLLVYEDLVMVSISCIPGQNSPYIYYSLIVVMAT